MRTYVGRAALRGAAQLLSNGSSRGVVLAGRTAIASKSLCTSTSLQGDGTRRPEDVQISGNEKLTLSPEAAVVATTQNESVVEIISEDVSSPSVVAEQEIGEAPESMMEPAARVLEEPHEGTDSSPSPTSSSLHRDPAAFAASLKSLLKSGAVRTALWQYANAMKNSDRLQIDEAVVALMLPVLGRCGWAPTSLDTLNLATEREYELGIGLFNCGLHAVSRSAEVVAMRKIIDKLWTLPRESHPNATTYNYLIGAHMYRGQVDKAFNVLNEMKDHLIYPTFATYHALITGCLRRRDSRRAFSTLTAVEKQRFDISAMTVAQVLVIAATNDEYDIIRPLLTKFESSLPRYVTEVHRIAESRNIYRIGKHTRTTREERATMRGTAKLEIGAISAVLHCAFRGGLTDVALHTWQIMEEQYPEFKPPDSFWYCLIGSFAGSGDFSTALDVVGVMRERGLTTTLRDLDLALIRPMASDVGNVDAQYYRLVDRLEGKEQRDYENAEDEKAHPDEGEPVEASELKDEQSASVEIDELEAAEQDRNSHEPEYEAKESFQSTAESTELDEASREFIRTRLTPTTVGIDELNCVIYACSSAQDLERAFQTYDELGSRFKVEKNIDTFNALLEGCVQTKHIRGGMRVLQEMDAQGFSLSDQALHLAVRLMIRGGRTETTVDMIEEAQRKGDRVSPSTYQMLVRHFMRNSDTTRAIRVLELGKEAGLSERAMTGRLDHTTFGQLKKSQLPSRTSDSSTASNSDGPSNQVVMESEESGIAVDLQLDEDQDDHGAEALKH
ncbi:hypothetical protein FGB62_30g122 [Gracilaria domingensis]|nr:hypothetical protein FGB62_30g122 [Gracilaria domingensis]